MTTTLPAAGDTITFATYKRVDFCTRPRRVDGAYVIPRSATDFPPCGWTCWLCHGNNTGTASVEHTDTIDHLERWADNSTEAVTVTGHRVTLVAPHGDAC